VDPDRVRARPRVAGGPRPERLRVRRIFAELIRDSSAPPGRVAGIAGARHFGHELHHAIRCGCQRSLNPDEFGEGLRSNQLQTLARLPKPVRGVFGLPSPLIDVLEQFPLRRRRWLGQVRHRAHRIRPTQHPVLVDDVVTAVGPVLRGLDGFQDGALQVAPERLVRASCRMALAC
jgi:hypothetical protein